MTRLYLKLDDSLEKAACRVGEVALPRFSLELRDGLNMGGGDYFRFADGVAEVFLVCNDADHAEVFVPERASFPYYCYVAEGGDSILESMKEALNAVGVACEIEEDA
jgi:hypothetical protein